MTEKGECKTEKVYVKVSVNENKVTENVTEKVIENSTEVIEKVIEKASSIGHCIAEMEIF